MAASRQSEEVNEVQAALMQAIQLHQSGEGEAALNAYDEFLTKVEESESGLGAIVSTLGTVHGNMGAIFMQMAEYEKAKHSFTQALSLNPEDHVGHYNLAILLTSKLNEHRKALKHARIAAKLDPENAAVLHLIANILQALGAIDEANRYFSMAEIMAATSNDASPLPEAGATAAATGGGGKMAWADLASPGLATARIGDSFTASAKDGREVTMQCISTRPLLFYVEGLLSDEECDAVVGKAEPTMEKSFVMGGDSSNSNSDNGKDSNDAYRSSDNTWLAPLAFPLLREVQTRLAGLTGFSLKALIAAAEELQVVRYAPGGQFKSHHDSTSFNPRLFTALVYLNSLEENRGGGTWFPFASSMSSSLSSSSGDGNGGGTCLSPVEEKGKFSIETAVAQAMAVQSGDRASIGITVQPKKGAAVLFFNYLPDGELDTSAVHSGLPVKEGEDKWAANYWYRGLEEH
jgi:hypothetical protein